MSALDLEQALARRARASLLAYLTAGFPDASGFLRALDDVERIADAVEIGVPFSDPMADGATIQRASHAALAAGATLDGLLTVLAARPPRVPRVLMSYLNPLLAIPVDVLAPRLASARIDAVVVPDLPLEERAPLHALLDAHGIALVPMVTPLTPDARLAALTANARGLVYAVTSTGTTGRASLDATSVSPYLERVRAVSRAPVIAGFGVRTAAHVAALCPPADGVVVGSALVEEVEAGRSPGALLARLRGAAEDGAARTARGG
jgi:tryptophan synthase alpha chain